MPTGRGMVGSRSVGEKPVSGQTAQGLTAKAVGSEPDTVIRGKEKSPAVPLPASKNGVAEGNAGRSGLEVTQSAPGRGVVGSRSGHEKLVSGQTAQGLTAEPVGVKPDTVNRRKQQSPSAPLPAVGDTPVENAGVTHGQP